MTPSVAIFHLLAEHEALEKQCEELKSENNRLRDALQALYDHCMSGQENYGAIDQAAAVLVNTRLTNDA